MNGVPLGAFGADYIRSGSYRATGSYLALQGMISELSETGSGRHANALGMITSGSVPYTEFESITWGRADAAGTNNFTSSKARNLRISSGEIIHGPIYAFHLLSGSCLAYLGKHGGDTDIGM